MLGIFVVEMDLQLICHDVVMRWVFSFDSLIILKNENSLLLFGPNLYFEHYCTAQSEIVVKVIYSYHNPHLSLAILKTYLLNEVLDGALINLRKHPSLDGVLPHQLTKLVFVQMNYRKRKSQRKVLKHFCCIFSYFLTSVGPTPFIPKHKYPDNLFIFDMGKCSLVRVISLWFQCSEVFVKI